MESIKVTAKRRKVRGFLTTGVAWCFMLCAFSFQPAKAQSFDEWFAQGKTQVKYLIQQIAALSTCESSLKQGYHIVSGELSSIKNFSGSEYSLHQGYYNSLSQVNPLVKKSTDMTAIQSEQESMISQFNSINNLSGLSAAEQAYIQNVAQNLMSECNKDLEELQAVLTPGKLVMPDDERVKRINKVTASIKDKYVFSCSFCTKVRVLALQRVNDSNSNSTLQKLYGINP
jgi:hypothetical protein